MDFVCLGYLCFFMWYKHTWRQLSKNAKLRVWFLTAIFVICTADLIQAAIRRKYPYLTNFMRPIVVLLFLSQIRANLKSIVFDLKDSLTVLATIFAFILFFTILGLYMFQGTY